MPLAKMTCQVCGTTDPMALRRAALVRPAVSNFIRSEVGAWDPNGCICGDDLQNYRRKYVHSLLAAEKGELTDLEREVIESLKEQDILSRNPDAEFETNLTMGQRVADRMADFGGSWTFLFLFALSVVAWISVNSYLLIARPFDPYPYILLNLILSCLAAIQAPVLMMSQNRLEARDRLRAMHDYQVNLKAELEIRHLHQKIDHLLSVQWERLVEIQEIQIELINEVRSLR